MCERGGDSSHLPPPPPLSPPPQAQLHDLKQAQEPSTSSLHTMTFDPAVNLVFQRMQTELKDSKDKLDQAQNDLSAWKFTPDRLVAF